MSTRGPELWGPTTITLRALISWMWSLSPFSDALASVVMEDGDEDKESYPHLLDDDEAEENDAIERNYSLPQPRFHSKIGS